MPSTYSNLGIELIASGDQAGTWGTTTNTNLGTLIDQAISGYATYACTGTPDTITIPNGATGVARNMYLKLTGTGGSTLTVPTNTKLYFIFNSTASAITVKTSGAGVSVPAGAKTVLLCDGTDIVVAENYLASLTLGAALPVASGGTSLTTLTANNVLLGNGTSAPQFVAPTTSGNILTANGTTWVSSAPATNGTVTSVAMSVPTFLSVAGSPVTTSGTLAVTLSGTALPIANGGTAATSASAARTSLGLAIGTDVPSPTGSGASGTWGISVTGNAANVSGTVAVANGGTGVTSTTAYGVLCGGTTSTAAVQSVAVGTTGQVLTSNGAGALPTMQSAFVAGMIIMWSGSQASIPDGWVICNGASGTPDLRNRFVIGAGNLYAVGDTGGSADATLPSHTHTATVTDPGHAHTYKFDSGGAGAQAPQSGYRAETQVATSTAFTSITVANSTEGVSGINANLSPYLALCYIMKT